MAHKEEILDYVMNSPQNTNPSVLGNMLDNYENGGSGGGITVIECEVRGNDGVYTLTNADKLTAAIDEMYEHWEKMFSYGVIIAEFYSGETKPNSIYVGRGTQTDWSSDGDPNFGFDYNTASGEGVNWQGNKDYNCCNGSYGFSETDIDENGVATLYFKD